MWYLITRSDVRGEASEQLFENKADALRQAMEELEHGYIVELIFDDESEV